MKRSWSYRIMSSGGMGILLMVLLFVAAAPSRAALPADTLSVTNPGANDNPFASGFNLPEGLGFDSAGNLVVANIGNDNGGGSSSSEITILNSDGGFIENITGFTDPAYFVDVPVPEPSPWLLLTAGAPCLLLHRRGYYRRAPTGGRSSLRSSEVIIPEIITPDGHGGTGEDTPPVYFIL